MNKNKLFTLIILFAAHFATISAQTGATSPSLTAVQQTFIALPIEFAGYVTVEDRTHLIDAFKHAEEGDTVEIVNAMTGKSRLMRMTDEYIDAKLADNYRLQLIAKAGKTEKDKTFYAIETHYAPEAESTLYIYRGKDKEWIKQELNGASLKPEHFLSDGLTDEQKASALSKIEWLMFDIEYDIESKCLVYSISLPTLSSEEKKEVNEAFKPVRIEI